MSVPRTRRKQGPYRNTARSVEARLCDLLKRMTIEEKIRQMSMRRISDFTKDGRISVRAVRKGFGQQGIGCLQDFQKSPQQNVAAINTIQKYFVENTRLGIPAIIVSECLHGHLSESATVFPQAIGLASTWNPALIRRMAGIVAKEARAVGVTQALAPDLDLARDPRWGRVEETYGEDPYLVAQMGCAYIKGMQGEGPVVDGKHLVCTAKHYAAHGSPEGGLNIGPVGGGLHDLRTLYLQPFAAAVREAGVLSIMPAYSEYDGIPAHTSELLLSKILREELGFRGYVISDYHAIHHLCVIQKTAGTPAEAGRQALHAGVDLEASQDYGFGKELLHLVAQGVIPVELIDRAVSRILRIKFLAGLFEHPFADAKTAARTVHHPAHRRLARELAHESIVLLKNARGLLPLDPGIRRIAVIGPNADVAQLGDYSKHYALGVTPLQGIRRAVSKRTEVKYEQGCDLVSSAGDRIKQAVEAAKISDVAIVVIGDASFRTGSGDTCPAATCGEGVDRSELHPPGLQEELVKAVHKTGTPTVVILINGRPTSIPWIAEHVPAIVEAWYPGEEGGNALADILFGKVNPSGRLPISVPRSVGHIPVFYNHKPSARGIYHKPGTMEAPGCDYAFSSPAPLYEFGHGLSYTTFRYSNLRVAPRKIRPGGCVTVQVDVCNVGRRRGKEIVQLYINDMVSSVTTPVKVLRRFEKIDLKPGERRTLRFVLEPQDLVLLDRNARWVVEPGAFEIMVGPRKRLFHVTAEDAS